VCDDIIAPAACLLTLEAEDPAPRRAGAHVDAKGVLGVERRQPRGRPWGKRRLEGDALLAARQQQRQGATELHVGHGLDGRRHTTAGPNGS
jgi:hypothetical protein